METIKKAVFGDNSQANQEPVSGQQGNPSQGEPYDADQSGDATNDNTNANTNNNTNTNTSGDAPADSEVKDSSQTQGDSTSDQNDTRDPSNSETKPSTQAAKSDVDNKGDLSGPGPQPVAKVAAEHGGDAGAVGEGEGGGADKADDEDDEDGPQKTSHGEGTGEQYVKSSGLKADGGDFDASAPGAGREADRLMEEKGIHNPTEDSGQPAPDLDETLGKKGLGERIKEKLSKPKMGH